MNTQQAYNLWSSQYDSNLNQTRDLEGIALRRTLAEIPFASCLEIGCGTGKNTEWLIKKAQRVTCVDLSEKMIAKAREKITSTNAEFIQADITQKWIFRSRLYDLVAFSLVLEHIKDMDHVLREASDALLPGGHVYIGELHPFRQYSGSKARFETENGTHVVECFNHHISDFTQAAGKNGFMVLEINEYFDNDDRNEVPRILTLVLKKK